MKWYWEIIIGIVFALIVLLAFCSGCQTKYITYESESVKVKYINSTFLSWAGVKDFIAKLSDGSVFGQGETYTHPDPNSVEAIVEGAIKGVKGI